MDEECQYNKPSCHTSSATEDDSILDFKSPKSKITKTKLSEYTKSNVIKQKKKTSTKFKNSVKNKKIQPKQHSEKSKNLQGSQPSIESSFFKSKNDSDKKELPSNEKVALVCPLCFKTFPDVNSQALHMKLCAFKNNISTKKLLDAIELQKRQEDERKSLGLLAAPVIQDKKKSVPRKINSHEDSDLQLALALSKSLKEAEELDEVNEIERLSEVTNQFVSEAPEVSESIHKTQLEQFGFASNKPISVTKKEKKRYNKVTPLQTRSQEERNRILTERIAEILMGNEPITQIQKEESQCKEDIKVEIVLRSRSLQTLCCKEDKLWDKARLTPSRKHFYVTDLSEYIIPQENQVEAKEEIIQFTNACEIKDPELNQNNMEACSNEKEFYEISKTDSCLVNKRCENCRNKQFTDTLVMNWRNALNDSSASDIIIFVNNGKHIWAHKLVLYVRCSNLLLEVVPNNTSSLTTIKEKICWFDVSYDIALGFLEFIYCGIIEKYSSIFGDLTSFSSLRNLARKYKVKELFAYLQEKEDETKQTKVQVHDVEDIEFENDTLKLNSNKSENSIRNRKEVLSLSEGEETSEEYLGESITSKSEVFENILKNTSLVSNIQSLVARDLNTQKLEESTHMEQLDHIEIDCLTPDMFDDVDLSDQDIRMQEIEKDEDLDSVKSIIFDSVNDTTDTTNYSKITSNVPLKNGEACIDSLSNTPHSSKSERKDVNDRGMIKLKSNLSLFIEKYQKENAKSDSDIDSETSILSVCPKLNRNPFNVKQYDSSTEYKETLEKEQDTFNKLDYNTKSPKSNVEFISLESDNDMHSSPESMGSPMQSIKYNEENNGEKYVKNNSAKKNVNAVDKEIQNEVTPSTPKNLLKANMGIENVQCNEDEDRILSDFEIEEDEISMYTRYKRERQNNSIIKYRNFIKEHILNNSVKDGPEGEEKGRQKDKRKRNRDSKDVTVLSNIDISSDFIVPERKYVNEAEKEESISDLTKPIQTLQEGSQNFKHESSINNRDDNCLFVDNISPVISQKHAPTIHRVNNLNKLKYSKSESNIDVKTMKNNSLMSLTQRKTNEYEPPESPVLVCSSPELDFDSLIENRCNQNNAHYNIPNLKEPDDISRIFENDIYLANVHVSEDSDDNNDDKSNIPPSVTKRKSTEKSLTTKESNRKFQKKSMSETSLSINTKSVKNTLSDFHSSSNPTLCKCGHKKSLGTTTSPIIIRDNVTPPPSYDGMKTPELHAELNKYGMKVQKRKKAVQLLTYIYNELHPMVCKTPERLEFECAVISSEDEEPPLKKINCTKNDVDCIDDCRDELPLSPASTTSSQSSVNIIDEERQFDEPESMTQADNKSNIKDAFFKLIKLKKELHNNVLTYEPLCIDSLHSMLKEKGFKCKKNTLMDFLDEQCITFYCQEMKQKKIARKRF